MRGHNGVRESKQASVAHVAFPERNWTERKLGTTAVGGYRRDHSQAGAGSFETSRSVQLGSLEDSNSGIPCSTEESRSSGAGWE